MTIPMEYRTAEKVFEQYLDDALEASGLATRNQIYTMTQGVFQCFRRRLEFQEALLFAACLPPLLRAMFVDDWDLGEPRRPFESVAAMTREVQALRRDHNTSPDTVIRDVAVALRKNVDTAAFERVLQRLPEEAGQFWRT